MSKPPGHIPKFTRRSALQISEQTKFCRFCNTELNKRTSKGKINYNKFCSQTCSAKHNNAMKPKKAKELKACELCGLIKAPKKRKFCDECKYIKRGDITLGEAIYQDLHKSSAFALVRTRARSIAKALGWSRCSICGYSKIIEIAHIKPINTFDENTKISEINDIKNLVPLCPNHHWEFDHGQIELPQAGLEPT